MVSPHLVGKSNSLRKLLSDVDVSGREFASVAAYVEFLGRLESGSVAYSTAKRLSAFFEALAEKDSAGADKVLRLWGIR